MKPTLTKDARRAEAIDKSQRIAALLSDPVVQGYLDNYLKNAMTLLLDACEDGDPDQIRAAGLRLKIMREMKLDLDCVIANGNRAVKQVSEI